MKNVVLSIAAVFLMAPAVLAETYTLRPGPEDGKDTCYGTAYVAAGCGDRTTLYAGGWADWYFDYFEFDLSGTPPSSQVKRAYFDFYYTPSANDPGFQVQRILEPWSEETLSRDSNPHAVCYTSAPPAPSMAGRVRVNITSLYKAWKDGIVPNYGIRLSPSANNQTNGSIASSENPSKALRPRLVIRYEP